MDMSGLLRNRIFWIGVLVPVALGAVFLAYGATRGASAGAAANQNHRGNAQTSTFAAQKAATSMSALANTPTVALPDSTANAVTAINDPSGSQVASSLATGSVDASQAHLLLADVGSIGASIYAATTSSGQVCIFDTLGPSGCTNEFDDSAPVAWVGTTSSKGALTQIAGLVPDSVQGVTVDEGSSSQSAILRNNAFYVEPAASPSAIVVAYKDGTSQSVALPSAADEANALKQLHSQQAKATP
jgi:hypothetical protein